MQIRDLMTSDVMVVRTDTPVKEAAELLLAHRVSGAPVVDASGALVGVVSELDFVRRWRSRGTSRSQGDACRTNPPGSAPCRR